MTPQELKEARHALGLSARGFASAVGGANPRTVRRWEAGEQDIPGYVRVLLRIWLDPRCPKWAKPKQEPSS